MNKRILILGLVLPFVACANPMPVTPPVIEAKPVILPDGTKVEPVRADQTDDGASQKLRSLAFKRVQTTIPRGAVIGEAWFQPLRCFYDSKLHYDDDRKLLNTKAYGDIFYKVFSGHGYRVAGIPTHCSRMPIRTRPIIWWEPISRQ